MRQRPGLKSVESWGLSDKKVPMRPTALLENPAELGTGFV